VRLEETVFDCTLTGGRKFASFVACKYAPQPVTRLSRKLLQSAKRPLLRVAGWDSSTDPEPAAGTSNRRAGNLDRLLTVPVDHQ
jgi:hypothetical protein